MAYDFARERLVLFGGGVGSRGNPLFGDTWEWDGQGWQLSASLPTPSARYIHSMASDLHAGGVVMFGGTVSSFGYLGDTWRFATGDPADATAFDGRLGSVFWPIELMISVIRALPIHTMQGAHERETSGTPPHSRESARFWATASPAPLSLTAKVNPR